MILYIMYIYMYNVSLAKSLILYRGVTLFMNIAVFIEMRMYIFKLCLSSIHLLFLCIVLLWIGIINVEPVFYTGSHDKILDYAVLQLMLTFLHFVELCI